MFLLTISQIVTGIGVGLFVVASFIFAWRIENCEPYDKSAKKDETKKKTEKSDKTEKRGRKK